MNHHVRRYFQYDEKERRDFFITTLLLTFILFFFVWRTTDYSLLSGFFAFVQFFVIALGSLFIFVSAAKLMAISRGYQAHYQAWITASLIGFVVSFTSYGFIPLIFPGLVEIEAVKRLRHGKNFIGENKYDIFTSLVAAPLASVFVTVVAQFIYLITSLTFFKYLMIFNVFLAFFSVLPFTKNIGIHLFYTNKTRYILLLLFMIAFLILTLAGVFFSAVFAVLGAAILWLFTKKFYKHYGV